MRKKFCEFPPWSVIQKENLLCFTTASTIFIMLWFWGLRWKGKRSLSFRTCCSRTCLYRKNFNFKFDHVLFLFFFTRCLLCRSTRKLTFNVFDARRRSTMFNDAKNDAICSTICPYTLSSARLLAGLHDRLLPSNWKKD